MEMVDKAGIVREVISFTICLNVKLAVQLASSSSWKVQSALLNTAKGLSQKYCVAPSSSHHH